MPRDNQSIHVEASASSAAEEIAALSGELGLVANEERRGKTNRDKAGIESLTGVPGLPSMRNATLRPDGRDG